MGPKGYISTGNEHKLNTVQTAAQASIHSLINKTTNNDMTGHKALDHHSLINTYANTLERGLHMVTLQISYSMKGLENFQINSVHSLQN